MVERTFDQVWQRRTAGPRHCRCGVAVINRFVACRTRRISHVDRTAELLAGGIDVAADRHGEQRHDRRSSSRQPNHVRLLSAVRPATQCIPARQRPTCEAGEHDGESRGVQSGGSPLMRIGIDLGGTKIEIIALDDAGAEVYRARVSTPRGSYEGTIEALVDLVLAAERVTGCCGTV